MTEHAAMASRPPSLSQWTLRFVEITMAVIAGWLLVETPRVLSRDFEPGQSLLTMLGLLLTNVPGLLLVMALLIFVELFLVLTKYHRLLQQPYAPYLLFIDALAGLLFLLFVELVKRSVAQPELLPAGMLVCCVFFVLLLLRQMISYLRVDHLEARLDTIEIQKKDLMLPMIADVIGALLCACIGAARYNGGSFVGIGEAGWCWIGVAGIAVYFNVVYILKFEWRLSMR